MLHNKTGRSGRPVCHRIFRTASMAGQALKRSHEKPARTPQWAMVALCSPPRASIA